MTDGWDDASSYGHTLDTPVLGSAVGPLHSFRLVARNSGLFYLSATHQALRLMKVRCREGATRLAKPFVGFLWCIALRPPLREMVRSSTCRPHTRLYTT
jgi:hypothetical protein